MIFSKCSGEEGSLCRSIPSCEPQAKRTLRARPATLLAALAIFGFSNAALATCPVGAVTGNTYATSLGDSCPDGLEAGATGIINAPSVAVPISGLPVYNVPPQGALAIDGGAINFSGTSAITIANTSAADGLVADGAGSVIDARGGTQIDMQGNGVAVEMAHGGLVHIDSTTSITLHHTGSAISINDVDVPDGTIGSGVVINLNNDLGGGGAGFGANDCDPVTSVCSTIPTTVTVDSLTVQGPGSATGVIAGNYGEITLTGTTNVTVNMAGGRGFQSGGPDALITGTSRPTLIANNSNFNTNGALARDSGKIQMSNGMDITITATGNGGYAANAEDANAHGSFIDATHGTTLILDAGNGAAARMLNGGLVKLDSTTLMNVAGDYSTGVLVDGTQVPDGTVGSGFTIHLNGTNEIGVSSTLHDAGFVNLHTPSYGGYEGPPQPSSVTMDHLTVTGDGARIGLSADSGSSITATNSSVTINGQNGSALDVEGGSDPYFPFPEGGTINFIDSTATANGAARSVARAILGTPSVPNTLNISNSTLSGSPQAAGITALSALLNVNIYDNSQVTGGNGMLVSAVDASALLGLSSPTPSVVELVSNTNSVLTGNAMADIASALPSTLDMTLNTATHWTGASLDATNITVDPTSLWTMNADSTVTDTVTNNGTIVYTVPTGNRALLSSYKTLTTKNYAGGGTLHMSTYLGTDGSPSDILVIDGGTVTGVTTLALDLKTEAGLIGPGDLTTANGILVVLAQNGAQIPPGSFTLLNGSITDGDYTYKLYEINNNWYLESTAQNVSIAKTSLNTQAVPGQTVTYTVTVNNPGPAAADGTLVDDPIPAGLTTPFTWTCTPSGGATCTASGSGALSDALTVFPSGASVTYTIIATVASTATGNITNTATVTPDTGGACNPISCTASVTLPTVVPAVGITKTSTNTQAIPNQTVTYMVTVNNPGPAAADGTLVDDPIPAGLTTPFTWTCTPSGGATCAASGSGALSDTLTVFPSGASATYTIIATVASTATGNITNTATATPPPGGSCNPVSCEASVPLPTSPPVVRIAKTSTDTQAVQGQTVTYTVTVTNLGQAAADGTLVDDPIPAGLTTPFTWACTPSGGATCTTSGSGALSDTLMVFPSGASATYTIIATVASTATGNITNTATATPPPGGSCNPVSCEASVTLPTSPPVVNITKTTMDTQAILGQPVTYTITVTNPGPRAADGTLVDDPIAAGLTEPATWSCVASGGATCTASGTGALHDTLTAFPVGSKVVYTFIATVAPDTSLAVIINTATATPPGLNRVASSDSVVVPVGPIVPSGASPVFTLSPAQMLLLMLLLTGIAGNLLGRRRAG
ncbi:MAG: DUF11 domain-containing protein [Rhodanobacter sp.]|jgi:uncharacterized repeat protein (TIGR01451 family)|nr:DUF11 domain-containing protein [Rhodanobacter sp.]